MIFIMVAVTIIGILWPFFSLWITRLGLWWASSSGSLNVQLTGSFRLGHSPCIFVWTCYLQTSLCHVYIPYYDILQGSSRFCNWFSLRRLVPWINHLSPVCWSTFWKFSYMIVGLLSWYYGKQLFHCCTHFLMPHNIMILYFCIPYFHVSNSALFST